MSTRGKARRLATNVWEDDKRRIGIAKVGKHRTAKRFPKDTSIRKITDWIEDTRRDLRKRRTVQKRQRGTLAGDIAAYLATLPNGRAKHNTVANLNAWLLVLGDVQTATLTESRLQRILNDWQDAGLAASTLKHRRRDLSTLLAKVNGPDAPNPARALSVPREPPAEPRGVDVHLLTAILESMDTHRSLRHPGRGGRGFRNKAQARLMMMLWTGISPASLQRLGPHDIDIEREQMTLPPRQKGRGAPAVTVPLFPQGVEACRRWLRAFAWGRFDQRALGKSFHAAVRRYVAQAAAQGRTVTLPPDVRPYDLRHSFLSWLWQETEDILVVQHFAQHLNLETTSRYTKSAVDPRVRAIVDRVKAKRLAAAVHPRTGKSA